MTISSSTFVSSRQFEVLHRNARQSRFILVLLLLVLFSDTALAACSFKQGTTIGLVANLTGSITVGRDVPVGTELYRTQAISTLATNVSCNPASRFNYSYASTPLPASGYVSSEYGGKTIYKTGVDGIGVVAWAGSKSQSFPSDFDPIVSPGTDYFWAKHYFYFSFVKTANVVGLGKISASSLPTVQYLIGSNKLLVEFGSAAGSLNVVSKTCVTPDVNVDMGTHYTSELSGADTYTANPVDFQISLNNCPAFFGRNGATTTNANVTTYSLGANSISYRLDPTTSVINAAQGIFALKSGGATGIGIQVLSRSNAPITLGVSAVSGLPLNQNDGTSYAIPLRARYYQTQSAITPGDASSSLTVTLTYL